LAGVDGFGKAVLVINEGTGTANTQNTQMETREDRVYLLSKRITGCA
jgi:hypothetical protein